MNYEKLAFAYTAGLTCGAGIARVCSEYSKSKANECGKNTHPRSEHMAKAYAAGVWSGYKSAMGVRRPDPAKVQRVEAGKGLALLVTLRAA